MTDLTNFDFHSFMSSHEAEMVKDACNAVTEAGLWNWVREFTPHENDGFFFAQHPNLDTIVSKMKTSHSAGSFATTMRSIEFIAKKGLKEYCLSRTHSIESDIWAWECKEPRTERDGEIIQRRLTHLKDEHAKALKGMEMFIN